MLRRSLVTALALLALGAAWLFVHRSEVRDATPGAAEPATLEGNETLAQAPPATPASATVEPVAEGARTPARGKGTLHVLVEDAAGAPIAGASVRPFAVGRPFVDGLTQEEREELDAVGLSAYSCAPLDDLATRTDAQGRAEVSGLPLETCAVLVSAEWHLTRRSECVELTSEQPQASARVALPGTGRLEIRVTDLRGLPLADLRVAMSRREPGAPGSPKGWVMSTDAAGTVVRDGLEAGVWDVDTDLTDPPPYASLPQAVQVDVPAGRTTVLDMPQRTGAEVLVEGVVSLGGEPFVGATLEASWMEDSTWPGSLERTSEEGGRYALPLPAAGRWMFVARFDVESELGLASTMSMWRTVDVPQAPRFALDLTLETGIVLGRVLDPEGSALAGASVYALHVDVVVPEPANWDRVETRTDEEGRYALAKAPAGALAVHASPPRDGEDPFLVGVSSGVVTLAKGATLPHVDLRLTRGGAVRGTVLDAAGQAVVPAWVELTEGMGSQWGALVDPDGSFEIHSVPPGELWLRAWSGASATMWTKVRVQANRYALADLVLAQAARIHVELEGPDTKAFVSILAGDGTPRRSATVRHGRTQDIVLAPGSYRVELARERDETDPARMTTATVQVEAGDSRTVRMRLP